MTRRDLRADDGVSLPELVVYVLVSSILVTLMCTMFVQITKATSDSRQTRRATGVAVNVMEEIARVVRQGTRVSTGATAVEGAVIGGQGGFCAGASGSTSSCLIVDTFSDVTVLPGQATIAPVRVTFSVDANGYLVERRYAGTLTGGYFGFPAAASSTRTVNGPISTTDPLFTYFAGTTAVTPSPALTDSQASSVTAIKVHVAATNPGSRGADPVLLDNTVTMPNIAILNGDD